MTDNAGMQPPGWYYAEGDPPGTQRYWDGSQWQGGPQPVGAQFNPGQSGGLDLADAGLRFVARLLDSIGYFVSNLIIGAVLVGGSLFSGNTDVGFGLTLVSVVASLALVFGNEVLATNAIGGTVGKKILSLKVVNADGSDVDQAVVIRRAAPYLAVTALGIHPILGFIGLLLTVVLAIVGLVMLFSDDERRLPWDRIANTRVVKA